MLIQHGGQHEPRAIYFPQYLAWQLVGGEGDFDILVLVSNICIFLKIAVKGTLATLASKFANHWKNGKKNEMY